MSFEIVVGRVQGDSHINLEKGSAQLVGLFDSSFSNQFVWS